MREGVSESVNTYVVFIKLTGDTYERLLSEREIGHSLNAVALTAEISVMVEFDSIPHQELDKCASRDRDRGKPIKTGRESRDDPFAAAIEIFQQKIGPLAKAAGGVRNPENHGFLPLPVISRRKAR